MHNGLIRGFDEVKRDLVLAVDPLLYPGIEGSTDSEVFFFLALTFGLEDNAQEAVESAVGLLEEVGRKHGVEHPVHMTVATTGGDGIWVFRYSSERDSRSLSYSTDVPTLRELHPELEVLQHVSDDSRLVVSEPSEICRLPGTRCRSPASRSTNPEATTSSACSGRAPSRSVAVTAGL